MTYTITQSPLTPDLKKHIFAAFAKHAIDYTGLDGLAQDPISFEIRENDKMLGCVVVQLFWGQLHIKYLLVEEPYRKQGIARHLMDHVFEFATSQGCDFAFVETMNFQAPEFYKKVGFKIDFVRHGYDKKTSFYYLSKGLNETDSSEITIRPFNESDIPILVKCFAEHNWIKPPSTFEKYLNEQQTGDRLIWIAHVDKQLAGYITLVWQSKYQPFYEMGIPEIKDLNVLPPYRKRDVGSKLIDLAEQTAAQTSQIIGIGVGLYEDYGEAQKLYIKKGYIPDGRGITHKYQPIKPGKALTLDDDLVLWFKKVLE